LLLLKDASKSWWKRAAEEADLIVSDDGSDDEDNFEVTNNAQLAVKQRQLAAILVRPLSMGVASKYWGKYPTSSGMNY